MMVVGRNGRFSSTLFDPVYDVNLKMNENSKGKDVTNVEFKFPNGPMIIATPFSNSNMKFLLKDRCCFASL